MPLDFPAKAHPGVDTSLRPQWDVNPDEPAGVRDTDSDITLKNLIGGLQAALPCVRPVNHELIESLRYHIDLLSRFASSFRLSKIHKLIPHEHTMKLAWAVWLCHTTEPGGRLKRYCPKKRRLTRTAVKFGDERYTHLTPDLPEKVESCLLESLAMTKTTLARVVNDTQKMYTDSPMAKFSKKAKDLPFVYVMMHKGFDGLIERFFDFLIYATGAELNLFFFNFAQALKRLAPAFPERTGIIDEDWECRRFLWHCRAIVSYDVDDFSVGGYTPEHVFARNTHVVVSRVRYFCWELGKRNLRTMLRLASKQRQAGDPRGPIESILLKLNVDLINKICVM
jgi:hypothetical protein